MGNGSGSGDTGCTSSNGGSYRHVPLTEEVLSRHNSDMQKIFMQRQRGGPSKPHKDKSKLKTVKKPLKRPGDRSGGLKRAGCLLEPEATLQKLPFLAPSAAGSTSSLKPSSAEVWQQQQQQQPENQIHIPSSGSVVPAPGPSTTHMGNLTAQPFPGIVPGYYLSAGNPTSVSPIPAVSNLPRPGPPIIIPQQSATFMQPAGGMAVPVPVQYIPGVMYQTLGPPLFGAPPLMLPNVVYQHTAMQPPISQVPVFHSDGEKRSGADSDHELHDPNLRSCKTFNVKHSTTHLRRPDSQATSVKAEPGSARGSVASASGKIVCSHLEESLRSYVEENTILSPGCVPKVSQFSQSTSVRAEAESIGSPGKQEKLPMEDDRDHQHETSSPSSDMVMSATSSSYSPGECKSTDDSLQNTSETSEMNESKMRQPMLSDPPWLENIKVTPELLYKYQMETKELVDVLRHDMDKLKSVRQPTLVDDQLSSLYNELELEGSSQDLHLEEGITSSSGEELSGTSQDRVPLRRKRSENYFSKMSMVHEEDAPLPLQGRGYSSTQHAVDTEASSSS